MLNSTIDETRRDELALFCRASIPGDRWVVGRLKPELTSALAAAAADEDELGGSARSRRASRPASRAGAAQDAPRGGTRRAE